MTRLYEQHATEDVAVPGKVLREAVEHDVDAVRERLEQERCGECRVDDACRPRVVRGTGDRRHVDERHERVGDHLGDHGTDIVVERAADQSHLVRTAFRREVDSRQLHSQVAEWSRDERIRAAVAGAHHDHSPALRRRDERDGEPECRLAASGDARNRGFGAIRSLEVGQRRLELHRGCIAVATVAPARLNVGVERVEVRVRAHNGQRRRRHQVGAARCAATSQPGASGPRRATRPLGHRAAAVCEPCFDRPRNARLPA